MNVSKLLKSDYSTLKDAVPMAVAVALGLQLQQFVKAILSNLVMPVVDPILGATGVGWQHFVVSLGPFSFPVGELVFEVLNFAIALYAFSVAIPIARKLM
jgi:large-conductance mechanosensitive channel